MSAAEPLLRLSDVVAGYVPAAPILDSVTVVVRSGETVAVIGPNGAGKSTLMKLVVGLLRPTRGEVVFDGEPIGGWSAHRITRRGIGYVPQRQNVFPSLSVEENLELAAATRRSTRRQQLERAYAFFPLLGAMRSRTAGNLSGGERQMLAIARALLPEPRLLLLDEPSAGLAPTVVAAVFAQLQEIARRGVTVLMVEQNAARALEIADRGYVLEAGQNRYEGAGRDLLNDPRVAELYLGG